MNAPVHYDAAPGAALEAARVELESTLNRLTAEAEAEVVS